MLMPDANPTLVQIANDIAALAPNYPQLAAFTKTSFVTNRELSYVYNAEADPSVKVGWRRGEPFPRADGVVISVRLLSDEEKSSLQEIPFNIGRLGDDWALVHLFDGKGTTPLAGPIDEILVRHGYVHHSPFE